MILEYVTMRLRLEEYQIWHGLIY